MHSQEMRPIFVYFYEMQLFSNSVVYNTAGKVYTGKELIIPYYILFRFFGGLIRNGKH